jgi:TolB-like protein
MKKFFVILLILFLSLNIYCNDDKNLRKRTVLILPFNNSNNVEKYDYLANVLKDTLESELTTKDQFHFKEMTLNDSKIKDLELTKETVLLTENALKIAKRYRADVVVIGNYTVENKMISIRIKAYDVFTGELAASASLNGRIGINVFMITDDIAKDMADRMTQKLPKISKTYFDEMRRLLDEEYKKEMKEKRNFTTANKVALGLSISGGCIVLAGLPILIIDIAYYYPSIVKTLEDDFLTASEDNKEAQYKKLDSAYSTYQGLLISSVILSSIGFVMCIVSIPLFFVKKEFKKKNETAKLNIYYTGNEINLNLSMKF